MDCALCKKPNPQLYSMVFEGPVHEKCHNRWLKELKKGKRRKKTMKLKKEE